MLTNALTAVVIQLVLLLLRKEEGKTFLKGNLVDNHTLLGEPRLLGSAFLPTDKAGWT